MKRLLSLSLILSLVFIAVTRSFFVATVQAHSQGEWTALDYAPAPADNPLKGFMPFYDAYGSAYTPIANDFPHSMEYFYVPLRDLLDGPATFTLPTRMDPQC